MELPALGLDVLHMGMRAGLDRRDHPAHVDAVLVYRVPRLHLLERHLVADRDVLPGMDQDLAVLVHDPAVERHAGLDALDHHDGHRVPGVVQNEVKHGSVSYGSKVAMGQCRSAYLPVSNQSFILLGGRACLAPRRWMRAAPSATMWAPCNESLPPSLPRSSPARAPRRCTGRSRARCCARSSRGNARPALRCRARPRWRPRSACPSARCAMPPTTWWPSISSCGGRGAAPSLPCTTRIASCSSSFTSSAATACARRRGSNCWPSSACASRRSRHWRWA